MVKLYDIYMAATVGVHGYVLRIEVHHRNQSNKTKLALYMAIITFKNVYNSCTYISIKM